MSRRLEYMPALDGLRAVAILLVLLTHAAKPYVAPGGFGVDVFFVLSGFLITTILWYELQATNRIALLVFYAKRAIRLVPPLMATIIITIPVALLLGTEPGRVAIDSIAAALYLTPVSTFFIGEPAFYGHLWTLAVEEYFYLVWPLIFLAMWRLRFSWQVIAALTITGGSALYLARIFLDGDLAYLRVGGIAIGCGIALIVAETTARGCARALNVSAIAAIVAACAVSVMPGFGAFAHPLAAASTVAVIFATTGQSRHLLQRTLETRPFTFIGEISYEIYLVHVLLLLGLSSVFSTERYVVWAVAYPLAFVLAALMHFGFLPMQQRLRAAVKRRVSIAA